jgi:hypothetical protein
MPHLQFTQVETRLASERHLKYQGTAKVGLDEITFHPTSTTKVDEAKLERLRRIFRKEGCRRLDVRNHATAVVSKTHLDRALGDAHVSASALLTNPPSSFPTLRFGVGQLQCLHGQHRIRIGRELLPPGDRWWSVDIYLEGEMSPLVVVVDWL